LQAFSFAFVAALYTLYRKADVYYTRDRYFAFFFSSLKFWHRRKIYYEAHTAGALEKWLMKKDTIDGLVVISNALKEVYIKQGVAREKVLVAPDGVGMKAFAALDAREQARRVLGMPLDRKIICYTGHLYGWKGVDILARSMHYLPPSYIAYLVGGTEEDVMRFREFILQENLTNVVMLGHVAPTLIPGYLAASDVLVLPNVGEGLSRYTSPLKLFEYMAAKRPIVASDLPAIREILNEETAILVAPGDPQALAEGVQKVISDQELARRIAERAYRDVQQYAWERRAEKIFEFMLSKKR
jgi:glycosyltransferase involved in cell wall biosynthesis